MININESAYEMFKAEYLRTARETPNSPVLAAVVKALEKQIPKPVIIKGVELDTYFDEWAACPVCGERVGFWYGESHVSSFCSKCGQALIEPEEK